MSQSHIDVSALASEACPVSEVLDHVSGKWSIGILVAAAQGPVGSRSWNARSAGSAGACSRSRCAGWSGTVLLVRTVHPVVPPKVEYTLTEMARELHKSLLEPTYWARRHGNTVATAQAAYDREHNRG